MNTTRLRLFTLFILLCGLLGIGLLPVKVAAQEGFRVTEVFLKADDARPTGKCPLTVKFNGYITANGAGTVKYTFTRSDGATAPAYALTFEKAGTQPVSTDWTLGDASALPYYEGWQAVKILSPNEMESSHETGSFVLKCAGAPKPQPKPQPQPPLPSNHARFRVTINGFKVLRATLDDLLQRDGKGDEVFFLSRWGLTDTDIGSIRFSGLLRSRVMGDATGRSDRVRAGSARPGALNPGMVGGFLTGDSFPNDPSVLSGSPTADRAPMLLFDGELTSSQVLVVVPTIWEQDGPDDLITAIGRALGPVLDNGARSVAPAPQYPGLLGRILATEGDLGTDVHVGLGLFGDPRDRPIGMTLGRDSYVFFPQRLRFSFADANEASRTSFGYGNGVIPITYTDADALQGNYTIFVQIQRL
ncbi:MAG: hypothetical protein M3033_01620 [Acidobacteriota bacterium]|nr:hypothetical protein [Acidobacteriota bacterium]